MSMGSAGRLSWIQGETAPTAVPPLYLGPQAGAVTALLVELDAGLTGNCPVESRSRDELSSTRISPSRSPVSV